MLFIVPLTEGDSLGAERQAGGRAGRNVSSCPGRPEHDSCSTPRASCARAVPLCKGDNPFPSRQLVGDTLAYNPLLRVAHTK
jgi:hypothetical protein